MTLLRHMQHDTLRALVALGIALCLAVMVLPVLFWFLNSDNSELAVDGMMHVNNGPLQPVFYATEQVYFVCNRDELSSRSDSSDNTCGADKDEVSSTCSEGTWALFEDHSNGGLQGVPLDEILQHFAMDELHSLVDEGLASIQDERVYFNTMPGLLPSTC